MPQEFQVLKCCECGVFQVQQMKKSRKWSCKMCGVKQSIIKVYSRGSGIFCRKNVQRLNLVKGEMQENFDNNVSHCNSEESMNFAPKNSLPINCGDNELEEDHHQTNKWSKYVTQEQSEASFEEFGEDNIEQLYPKGQDITGQPFTKGQSNHFGARDVYSSRPRDHMDFQYTEGPLVVEKISSQAMKKTKSDFGKFEKSNLLGTDKSQHFSKVLSNKQKNTEGQLPRKHQTRFTVHSTALPPRSPIEVFQNNSEEDKDILRQQLKRPFSSIDKVFSQSHHSSAQPSCSPREASQNNSEEDEDITRPQLKRPFSLNAKVFPKSHQPSSSSEMLSKNQPKQSITAKSKWTQFLETEEPVEEEDF